MAAPEISDKRLIAARIPLLLPCETCKGGRFLPDTKRGCGTCMGKGEVTIFVLITDLHRLIDRAHQVEWDRRILIQEQEDARTPA